MDENYLKLFAVQRKTEEYYMWGESGFLKNLSSNRKDGIKGNTGILQP